MQFLPEKPKKNIKIARERECPQQPSNVLYGFYFPRTAN